MQEQSHLDAMILPRVEFSFLCRAFYDAVFWICDKNRWKHSDILVATEQYLHIAKDFSASNVANEGLWVHK